MPCKNSKCLKIQKRSVARKRSKPKRSVRKRSVARKRSKPKRSVRKRSVARKRSKPKRSVARKRSKPKRSVARKRSKSKRSVARKRSKPKRSVRKTHLTHKRSRRKYHMSKKNKEIKVTIKAVDSNILQDLIILGILTVKLNKDTLIPFSNNSIIRYFINKHNKLDMKIIDQNDDLNVNLDNNSIGIEFLTISRYRIFNMKHNLTYIGLIGSNTNIIDLQYRKIIGIDQTIQEFIENRGEIYFDEYQIITYNTDLPKNLDISYQYFSEKVLQELKKFVVQLLKINMHKIFVKQYQKMKSNQ